MLTRAVYTLTPGFGTLRDSTPDYVRIPAHHCLFQQWRFPANTLTSVNWNLVRLFRFFDLSIIVSEKASLDNECEITHHGTAYEILTNNEEFHYYRSPQKAYQYLSISAQCRFKTLYTYPTRIEFQYGLCVYFLIMENFTQCSWWTIYKDMG